jgi:hypothetical protein
VNTYFTKKTILLFLVIFSTFILCTRLSAKDYVTSLKSPSKFIGIESDCFVNINIHKGNTYQVSVFGPLAEIQKVIPSVDPKDQILKIKYIHTPFLGLRSDVIVLMEITMPELHSISLNGSGVITTKDKFQSAILSLSLAGSGDINLSSIQSNATSIEISGSGSIKMSGNSSKMELALAGSGGFIGDKFKVEDADVSISGSGEVRTNVTRTLSATISGSGSIYYLGKPTVNRVITGSGDVAPLK